jgi:hypothetical protein
MECDSDLIPIHAHAHALHCIHALGPTVQTAMLLGLELCLPEPRWVGMVLVNSMYGMNIHANAFAVVCT